MANLVVYKNWQDISELPDFGFVPASEFQPEGNPNANKTFWVAFNSNKTCVCSLQWRYVRHHMNSGNDLFAVAPITQKQRNRYRK